MGKATQIYRNGTILTMDSREAWSARWPLKATSSSLWERTMTLWPMPGGYRGH